MGVLGVLQNLLQRQEQNLWTRKKQDNTILFCSKQDYYPQKSYTSRTILTSNLIKYKLNHRKHGVVEETS